MPVANFHLTLLWEVFENIQVKSKREKKERYWGRYKEGGREKEGMTEKEETELRKERNQ